MPRKPWQTFSVRSFFAFCTVIGLLCAVRWYVIAVALFASFLLYFLLYSAGTALARLLPAGRHSSRRIIRKDRPRPRNIDEGPLVATVCFLVVLRFVSLFLLVAFRWPDLESIWCTPGPVAPSLAAMSHLLLILFHVYVVAGFLGDCYATGHVSSGKCGMTTCVGVALGATHFAIVRAF
jgi:hypothetical protein